MKFSKLSSDQKTINHIELFFNAFLENEKSQNKIANIQLFQSLGNIIQKRELEDHLKRLNCTENNQEVCLKWIEKNASSFRNYLNSLTIITFALYSDYKINNRNGLTKRYMFDMIKVWDDISELMEILRLNIGENL